MRHSVRFGPALANALAETLPIVCAIMAIAIAAVVWQGVPMTPANWRLMLAVFAAALVLTALMSGASALFNYYTVDSRGISYRTTAGTGVGTLVLKRSGFAAWEDIVAARTSRWLPFRTVTLTVERPFGGRRLTMALPLYVRDQQALLRDLSRYVPVGHSLRAALGL